MFIHHCASGNAVPNSYEDVKMVVDVLQRTVLGKAREIHYLPLMSSRSAAGQQIAIPENPIPSLG